MDENQIEEIATIICGGCPNGEPCIRCLCADWYSAERLYKAGYRKQTEAEWIKTSDQPNCYDDFYCSHCKNYTDERNPHRLGKYCSFCGSKMKGGE